MGINLFNCLFDTCFVLLSNDEKNVFVRYLLVWDVKLEVIRSYVRDLALVQLFFIQRA